MSSSRPVVRVYNLNREIVGNVSLPTVFTAPLRPDLVRSVHKDISKNKRQPYSRKDEAGYGYSAQSWGTGRAVSRIPRVRGSGTAKAGQGAFGNMCRGGGMFSPIRIWRRWYRKVNIKQKRHAMATSIAASSFPPIVMARGHRIEQVPELPLVVDDSIESLKRTREAVKTLKYLGLNDELKKVVNTKHIRAGKGKMRNRRIQMRLGPMIVYKKDDGIIRAFRNIAGINLCEVSKLSILEMAPGGNFGRMVIWSKSAFEHLQKLYGSYSESAELKKGYRLLRPILSNSDIAAIINSDEVQTKLNPKMLPRFESRGRINLLKNIKGRCHVDPLYAERRRERERNILLNKLNGNDGNDGNNKCIEDDNINKKRIEAKKAKIEHFKKVSAFRRKLRRTQNAVEEINME